MLDCIDSTKGWASVWGSYIKTSLEITFTGSPIEQNQFSEIQPNFLYFIPHKVYLWENYTDLP